MRLRPYRTIALTLLVFVGSLVYLTGRTTVGQGGDDAPGFHIDEAHKAGEAYYYHLFFEQGDLDHPDWTRDFYARTNPPVGKYVFGAALAASGHPVRNHDIQHAFDAHWSEPERLRTLVPDGVLRTTRRTSAVFGALICAAIFVMAYRTFGTLAGLIAVVLLLGNPYFARYSQRGLTDSILLFHLALIVPVAFWSAGVLRRHWRSDAPTAVRRWLVILAATAIVPGVVIALATASKLNGALAGFAYAAVVILVALQRPSVKPLWRRLGLATAAIALAVVVSVTVFVAINPFFYDDPFGKMVRTLETFRDWTLLQQISPGGGAFTLHQKTSAVGHYGLRSLHLPLATYLGTAGTWLTVLGFSAGVVALVGACLGLSLETRQDEQTDATRQRRVTDARIVASWVLVCILGITLWLPLTWDRYMLPPYLAVALTTAIGLVALLGALSALPDALAGELPAPMSGALLAGSLATAGLWVVLALTDVVIDPLLLRNPEAWTDPDAIDVHGDSAIARHNIAMLLWSMGSKKQAAEGLEKALSLLDHEPPDRTATAVQRSSVLYDLARAYAAMGRPDAAINAFREHLVILRRLRSQIGDTDDYVEGAFDAKIAERQKLLDSLTGARGRPTPATEPSSQRND